MKTIYYYGIDNNKAGMETYALNLISNILSKSNDYKFHIISQYEDFAYKDIFVDQLKCDYTIVPKLKKHPIKYVKTIKKILMKSNDNDLFHLNLMSYRNFLLLHATKASKIKTMIVAHASKTDNLFNLVIHKFFRCIYKKLGYKIANNNIVSNYMFGKNAEIFETIPLGIQIDNFRFCEEKREILRKKFSVAENDILIGQIGRISKTKNQTFTLEVLQKIKNHQNVRTLMVGKENTNTVRKLISKKSIDNVTLLGEVADMQKIYSGIDIFVFPSLYESTGLALYEALANGCYCICSNNVPRIDNKNDRLIYLDLSEDEWAKEIDKIINNKTYKRSDALVDVPSLEKEINSYLELYNKLTK